jgi:two-component system LytT family response regulator
MKVKAIIIDDEKMARNLLKGMLEEYCEDVEVLETCNDLPSGVKAIRKLKPNLVFLDIEMPRYSGLELLDFFEDAEINFSIVFTTAYNQYAIQAFKLSAIDYLLKPIESAELEKSVERFKKNILKTDYSILKENLKGNQEQKLAISTINSVKFVELSQIVFFKAEGAYTDVYLLDEKKLTVSKGLKHFEDLLKDNSKFFRCHKSFVINTDYITEHIKSEGGFLKLNEKHLVSLSIDKTAELYQKMNWINR